MFDDEVAGVSEERLAEIVASLPGELEDIDIAISPTVFIGMRTPDVVFAHPVTDERDLIAHLAIARPRYVFIERNQFNAEAFAEDQDGEVSEELLALARRRSGELHGVMVTWQDAGIISSWTVSAGWYEELSTEADTSREVAEGMEQLDREQRREHDRAEVRRRLDIVMGDASFRAATPMKRTAQALVVLKRQGEEVDELWMIATWFKRILLSEARFASAAAEDELVSKLKIAAESLAQEPNWAGHRTKAKRREAARDFALRYTEGWTPSDPVVDRLIDAALKVAQR